MAAHMLCSINCTSPASSPTCLDPLLHLSWNQTLCLFTKLSARPSAPIQSSYPLCTWLSQHTTQRPGYNVLVHLYIHVGKCEPQSVWPPVSNTTAQYTPSTRYPNLVRLRTSLVLATWSECANVALSTTSVVPGLWEMEIVQGSYLRDRTLDSLSQKTWV